MMANGSGREATPEFSYASVIAILRENQLLAVPLSIDPAVDDNEFWTFDGSIEAFARVAKELGAKAVYVITYAFASDDLMYSADQDDDEGDEDGDEDEDEDEPVDASDDDGVQNPIDLTELEPGLAAYRSRVGESWYISLLAITSESKLQLQVVAPWYEEMEAIKRPIVERLEASVEERERTRRENAARERDDERARRNEEQARVLKELGALPQTVAFRALKTKGAMVAYVNEHFPSAKDVLSPSSFREMMTNIYQRTQLERTRR